SKPSSTSKPAAWTCTSISRPSTERPSGRAAEQRDERATFHCPMPPVLLTERIAHPRHGRLLHPSSWAERDDRDHSADNFFQQASPKTGHPISPPGPPHRQKSFLTKFPGMAPG